MASRFRLRGLLFQGCLFLAACSGRSNDSAGLPTIVLGEQVTLLDNGALGLSYFPDEGTSLIQRSPSMRLVLTATNTTYLVEGSDLQYLSQAVPIVAPGAVNEFDNGYAGVSAVVRVGDAFYGFYHAEDQQDLPALEGGIPGYFASIGLVTSNDGTTWTKQGQVVTSSQPKSWTAYPNQGDRGAAEPGAVQSRDGRYLYLYYTEHSRVDGRSVDICIARADLQAGPPKPGAFRKLRNGAFSEPGLGGQDSPIVTADEPATANALEGHVTYSEVAQKYLMVYGIDAFEERMAGREAVTSGVYATWSDDGVAWSKGTRLIADQAVPQTGASLSWEASVIWDDDSGRAGMLVYGYTPSWGTTPHYLVGRHLTIEP